MANTNLFYDASGQNNEIAIERFNDGKCAIVTVSLKFNSTGNISKIPDAQLLAAVKEMFKLTKTNIQLT